jgi:channel protein (hemolysin III family)
VEGQLVDAAGAVVEAAGAIPGFCQPVSSLSHLAAAGAALVAAVPLVRLGRRFGYLVPLSAYALCVIATLAISGTYHALGVRDPTGQLMQRLDYLAIWLVIAGTFTAVHWVMFTGFWRGGLLLIIWSYALIGIVLQACWFETFSGNTGVILYLGLGWIGLASIIKLRRQMGSRPVRPFLIGGVAFTVGALLDICGKPVLVANWIGPHEFFHVTVIAGLTLHWRFIQRLVILRAQVTAAAPTAAAPTSA